MIDNLWIWLQTNWLYVVPYILVIIGTHFLKTYLSVFQKIPDNIKGLIVLCLSLGISTFVNFIIMLFLSLNVYLFILLSLLCWAVSGFLTIIIDKFIAAGLPSWIQTFIKNILTGGK